VHQLAIQCDPIPLRVSLLAKFGQPSIDSNPLFADQFFAASAGAKTGPGQNLLQTLFHKCSSTGAVFLQLAVF
jgi:hypothetical protein